MIASRSDFLCFVCLIRSPLQSRATSPACHVCGMSLHMTRVLDCISHKLCTLDFIGVAPITHLRTCVMKIAHIQRTLPIVVIVFSYIKGLLFNEGICSQGESQHLASDQVQPCLLTACTSIETYCPTALTFEIGFVKLIRAGNSIRHKSWYQYGVIFFSLNWKKTCRKETILHGRIQRREQGVLIPPEKSQKYRVS